MQEAVTEQQYKDARETAWKDYEELLSIVHEYVECATGNYNLYDMNGLHTHICDAAHRYNLSNRAAQFLRHQLGYENSEASTDDGGESRR